MIICITLLLLSLGVQLMAQPGPIKNLRYQDDWRYLNNDTVIKKGLEKLKYISLSKKRNIHISFGGEIREWWELRGNPNFGDVPPGYVQDKYGVLQHRFMLHTDFWAGNNFRVFGQLNNTFQIGSNNEPIPEIIQDGIGVHQLFFEYHILTKPKSDFFLRIGRQEYSFGNEMLISSREGPNNRQAFDGASLVYGNRNLTVHLFAATPIIILPNAFDNQHINEYIWGGYFYLQKQKKVQLDAYYMGFKTARRLFNFVPGKQTRHTLGARIHQFGKKLRFDVEGMYQVGKFNLDNINAYKLIGQVLYEFPGKLKPVIGLGGSYISGDRSPEDRQLNTYDPLYPKPMYGLAAPLGPSNIMSIQPKVGLQPVKGMMIYFSIYKLARQSAADGTYAPSMVQVRPFAPYSSAKKSIGTQYALDLFYIPNPNWVFISFISYLKPGDYVNETGMGKPVFYLSLSGAYKF